MGLGRTEAPLQQPRTPAAEALPLRVEPLDDESGLGWAVRLAEANFLPSAWHLFTAAGMTQSNMALLRFDPTRLARLAGVDPQRLKAFSCHESHQRAAWVEYRGSAVGRTKLRNGIPQVCQKCLRTNGYARAVWDFLYVTACPEHQIELIERCGACGNYLSWLRPGVDVCRCGALISATPPRHANGGATAISALVECILHKTSSAWERHVGPVNAAVSYLVSAPLAVGLAMISGLAGVALSRKEKSSSSNIAMVVEAAGNIVRDWPRAFHVALDSRVRRTTSAGPQDESDAFARVALHERRTFGRIAMRHGVADGLVVPEVLRFIVDRLPDLFVDSRLTDQIRELGVEPLWVSLREAAKRLKIDSRSLARLVAERRLESRQIAKADQVRTYVRVADLRPELASTRTLQFRAVVASTGLPAQVLRALRESGELPSSNGGVRRIAIAARDLEALTKRWSRIAVRPKPKACETIRLHEALRLPLARSSMAWKIELVRRVFGGAMPVYSVRTKPHLDATLSRADVLSLKATFERERLTLGDMSTALALTKMSVLRLIVDGMMRADLSEPEIKIHKRELQTFECRFVRLGKLAGRRVRADALARRCEDAGVTVVWLEGRGGVTPFAIRTDEARIRKLVS